MKRIALFLSVTFLSLSCSNEKNDEVAASSNLIVKIKFDKNQERLDNLGNPATVAAGNAAQTPTINAFSAHYIELAPTATTLLGDGEIIYEGEETTKGGAKAIDFSKATLVQDNETFLEIPLSEIKKGTYKWVRISASYQNGSIKLLNEGTEYDATIAGFIGYNNYIESFELNGKTIEVNDNKLQGFWGFEAEGYTLTGQAPEGAVTVPNPLFETSPIPQGSCVLTGDFSEELEITGNETEDIVVTLSFSVNNSFEWKEVNMDGKYEPTAGEELTDMGLRGLKVSSN
ncbi:hypothetical protein [Galbibacter mesophilus]|uniref:hypothetical protein n=1 Tax=Galbibacter mesophilus TaxID=379069 RepID=UPI00191EBBFF|nr:hypothetical protein [Galbibacter mesophilus]MCM5662169.1 hypothetical protein [Galbibacter mesophilus]